MKYYTLIIGLSLLSSTTIQGQQLIATDGNTQQLPDIHVAFSVGEPVVGTVLVNTETGETMDLWQGFQQPYPQMVILPLEWLNVSGRQRTTHYHQIYWTVLHDGLNEHFVLERSSDAIRFSPLATIAGKGETGTEASYSYDDYLNEPAIWYYRIRQVDFDGYTSYSDIVRVGTVDSRAGLLLYPNPTRAQLWIEWPAESRDDVTIKVWSPQGRLAQELVLQANGKQQLDVQTWPAGMYMIRWSRGTDSGYIRLIKQ